ncbi:MAG: ArsA family ATPase [Thermoleophilaceae bacterium]|nr:ArsA family ATPase [Thermoleophilaceae bacterium]
MLLDRRLIFVTGKGGVGKTTVAAALGLAAARAGKKTIVCEVQRQSRMSAVLAREGVVEHEETEIADGLWAISVDPDRAVEEYLRYQLRSRALYKLLVDNRIFQYLFAAAPGARELVTIGKLWELAQVERKWTGGDTYDLVIVDAPATGHGLGLLNAPKTFRDIARVGPIASQADQIHTFFTDPKKTAVALVALPEEMPVNETLDFQRLLAQEMGRATDLTVVNALYPQRFTAREAEELAAASEGNGTSEPARAAITAAVSEHVRAKGQRRQLGRLRRGSQSPVSTLPYIFEPELDLDDVEELSRKLERAL